MSALLHFVCEALVEKLPEQILRSGHNLLNALSRGNPAVNLIEGLLFELLQRGVNYITRLLCSQEPLHYATPLSPTKGWMLMHPP